MNSERPVWARRAVMASQNGRREGDEEAGKAEAGAGELKPSQMDLIIAMLADAEKRADERACEAEKMAEETTREQARELARRLDEQAERARHLAEVLEKNLSSLREETQLYTDQVCDSEQSERLEEVQ